MRVHRRAPGVVAAASLALLAPEIARAQGAAQPAPARERPAVPALSERRFEAHVAALVAELQPAQLGRTWRRVVDAALQRLDELPQATPPPMADDAATLDRDVVGVPDPSVMVDETGPAETVPEAGPNVELGPVRVIFEPVVADFPVITNGRSGRAILLGTTLRLPWTIP